MKNASAVSNSMEAEAARSIESFRFPWRAFTNILGLLAVIAVSCSQSSWLTISIVWWIVGSFYMAQIIGRAIRPQTLPVDSIFKK